MTNLNTAGDYIKITGLKVYAYHGVLDFEKEKGQTFVINANIYYNMENAGDSDLLEDALNYAQVCDFMAEKLRERSWDLIERAATVLCESILQEFDVVTSVQLELCKPFAPIGRPFENVSVNLERSWHVAYVALGSNMGDKKQYLEDAILCMRENPWIRDVRVSTWIETEPYGYTEQDTFVNGVAEIRTLMSPMALLEFLHMVENDAGRKREIHWGPRTLDLDILMYDDLVLNSQTLTIPHVDMCNRDFVLYPLRELAAGAVHPVKRMTVAELCEVYDEKKTNSI